MPPQLTDISPGIERDAAKRGLGLSMVQAKRAVDQALAARLKSSAAALESAVSDKDGARPAARSVLGLLKQYWSALWQRRQGRRLTVQDLSDRDLMDIGLTRGEVDHFTPERVIDRLRDRAADPWSRGVM
ncbi:MAG TPA: DUF1127 domain-containing protein [Bradyrhizobium sp.]|nr:DUF1127 domain-containing protein [Bradyrhizobium sp.]